MNISFFLGKLHGNRIGKKCYIARNVRLTNALLEGANKVWNGSVITNSDIGYGTYIGKNAKIDMCKIGRYCSIANDFQIAIGNHPTSTWVSTHPAFFSVYGQAGIIYTDRQRYEEIKYVNDSDKAVIIGSDVWIGQRVTVLNGIKIGNGSIIAAGAVVVDDTPDYSIVGGIPARVIKYRFTDEEIEFLKELKWWEKDTKWIKAHAELFDSIQKLRDKIVFESRGNLG